MNQNNAMTDSEGDDDDDDNGGDGAGGVNQMDVNNKLIRGADSTHATAVNSSIRTEVQQNTPIIAAQLIPPPEGMTEDEYSFQVMDMYINAKAWGICWRKVYDEYFGNDKGQRHMLSTYFHDLRRIQQLRSMNNVVHVVLYSHHRVAAVIAVSQIYLPSYHHNLHLPNCHAVNTNLSLRTTR